ncbi:MAG: WxL domain-containing protein, partial [Alicyclobacillus shizuokensis]|nr:WxL domain-containing protein [Alicyclobacillus shizuokensis]
MKSTRFITRRSRSLVILAGTVGTMLLAFSSYPLTAQAETLPPSSPQQSVQVGIVGGTLSVQGAEASDFHWSAAQPGTAWAKLGQLEVVDARGTGAGWTLTVSASPVVAVTSRQERMALPAGSLEMASPTVRPATPLPQGAPPNVTVGPLVIDTGSPVSV